MYALRLLGGFALLDPNGEPTQRLSQRRAEALLAVLALSGDLGCTRDRLVGLLWPESTDPLARHSLRNALHALRTTVDPDIVRVAGDALWLNGARVTSDVQRFARALESREPGEAVRVYAGPFLDGFHVDDAPEFEQWMEDERARLFRRCAGALEDLAIGAESACDWHTAASWWQRAAEHDPHDSRVVLRLMRALATAGDRANALLQAEAHRRRLWTDLEIEPDVGFTAAVAQLRADTGAQRGAPVPPAPAAPAPMRSAPPGGVTAGDLTDGPASSAATPGTPTPSAGALSAPPSAPSSGPLGRRKILAILMAVVVVAGGASLWLWLRRPPPPPDADVVAVVPFSWSHHARLQTFAEEFRDVIVRELLEGPAPQAVEPAVAAVAWERAKGDDARPDPRAVDADVARRTGASLILRGRVDSAAGGPLLTLTLVRLPQRHVVAQRTASVGEVDSPDIVRRLLLEVLALEAGQPAHRLAELVSHPAPAVRLFLAGVRREGAVASCRDMLSAVWALDSTLVYPGLACLVGEGFQGVNAWRDSVARAVWRRRASLVNEDAAYADALVGPWFGLADDAERRLALWRVAADAAPDWWVPSTMLAQELVNFGPRTTLRDWKGAALFALHRALRASAWSQRGPVEMAFWSGVFFGDTALARRAAEVGPGLRSGGPQYPFTCRGYWFSNPDDWPWLFDAAFGSGAAAAGLQPARFGGGRTGQAFRALRVLALARPRTAVHADSFAVRWARTPEGATPRPLHYWVGLHWRARGDFARWRQHARLDYQFDWAKQTDWFDDLVGDATFLREVLYYGLPGDTLVALKRARLQRVALGDSTPAPPPGARGIANCWLAQWRLGHGDTTGVARAISLLRALDVEDRAGRLDGLPGSGRWVVCPALLEAQRARVLGRDALAAARALDRLLRPLPLPRRSWFSLLEDLTHDQMRLFRDNLMAARLLAAAGDTAAALVAVRRRPQDAAMMLDFFEDATDHLRLEGRLAAATADTLGAVAAYERYLALRSAPPAHPPWRAEWDSVRAELGRLRPRP